MSQQSHKSLPSASNVYRSVFGSEIVRMDGRHDAQATVHHMDRLLQACRSHSGLHRQSLEYRQSYLELHLWCTQPRRPHARAPHPALPRAGRPQPQQPVRCRPRRSTKLHDQRAVLHTVPRRHHNTRGQADSTHQGNPQSNPILVHAPIRCALPQPAPLGGRRSSALGRRSPHSDVSNTAIGARSPRHSSNRHDTGPAVASYTDHQARTKRAAYPTAAMRMRHHRGVAPSYHHSNA